MAFSAADRGLGLAVGGLVALTAELWRRLPAILAAILGGRAWRCDPCSRTSGGQDRPYPSTAALPVLGTKALVIGAGCATSLEVWPHLAVSPIRAAGRLSYSWYLWHWPVLMVLLFIPIFWVYPLLLVLALLVISGVLAWLTCAWSRTRSVCAAVSGARRTRNGAGRVVTAVAVLRVRSRAGRFFPAR